MQSNIVSILMPAKNAGEYIKACIDSVIAQTYPNWELIIINDHSTDNTVEILKNFEQNSRIIWEENLGIGIISALTQAFNRSTGKWITRMDADDLMPPQKLKTLISAVPSSGKFVITGKVRYFSNGAVSEGYFRYQQWLNQLIDTDSHWKNIYRECVIASPNWLVDRNCFEQDIALKNLNYPEDYDMMFKWYCNDYQVIGVDEVTHLWREHPKRTSRNSAVYQQTSFFKLKMKYFLRFQHRKTEIIQVIGAGKKGKLIVDLLKATNVDWKWFDLGHEKFNQPIKGKKILAVDKLEPKLAILTVWPMELEAQKEVLGFLESKGLILGENLFLV